MPAETGPVLVTGKIVGHRRAKRLAGCTVRNRPASCQIGSLGLHGVLNSRESVTAGASL
jgi:hypothetical protein